MMTTFYSWRIDSPSASCRWGAGSLRSVILAAAVTLLCVSVAHADESIPIDGAPPSPPSPVHTSDESADNASATMIAVVGAPGTPEYQMQFAEWAERLRTAANEAKANWSQIGDDESEISDKHRLQKAIEVAADMTDRPLWIIFIGHGTYYREQARFNLRGRDVLASELADWIDDVKRPIVLVNCTSSSGPFINRLSGPNRVIVTATNSGAEQNLTRFGNSFSVALVDPQSDLDHDDEVSVLEAFLSASGKVAQFYEQQSRLATEHALLDDNGDKIGTPASFYRGIRVISKAKDDAQVDGSLARRITLVPNDSAAQFTAEQLSARATIELAIETLRGQKERLDEDEYYRRLEPLMIQLAKLYAAQSKSLPVDAQTSRGSTRPQ